MTGRSIRGITGAMAAGALLVALTSPASAQMLTGLKAVEPQPAADRLQPGLAVGYVYGRFNHLNEFMTKKFEPGKPLPNLDYRMGDGAVLTTKERDQVGALITGFIRFEKPGTYGFDVTSNDGVRVEIGEKLLYEDPTSTRTTRRTGSTSRSTSRAGTRSRSCTTRRRALPRSCCAGCRWGATPRPSPSRCRPPPSPTPSRRAR